MTDQERLRAELVEMADHNGEIAFTSNTRVLLEQGETFGIVKPVSGKFRMVESGHLNSIYRIVPEEGPSR